MQRLGGESRGGVGAGRVALVERFRLPGDKGKARRGPGGLPFPIEVQAVDLRAEAGAGRIGPKSGGEPGRQRLLFREIE